MPNTLSALPASTYKLTHDPTKSIAGDVGSDIAKNPFAEMTSELLFGMVNDFLGVVDDATGLDLLDFATALEGLLGGPIGLLSGFFSFLTPGTGTTSHNVLSPLTSMFGVGTIGALPNVLAQIGTDGLLLVTQIPQIIPDLITTVENAWGGVVTTLNPVTGVLNALTGILGIGGNAQAVNTVQDAKINALLAGPGAVSIFDTFAGPSSPNLDPAIWDQQGSGPGAGTFGTDGSGNAVFYTSGFNPYTWVNRNRTVLTTDTMGSAITLATDLTDGGTTQFSAVAVHVRENLAKTERVQAHIDFNGMEIGYVLAGTYTRLGLNIPFSSIVPAGTTYSTAGTWEIDAGTTGSAREFVLYHNGVEMMRRTDTGAVTAMGPSNRFAGFEATTGVSFFFWYSGQYAPPPITSFAAGDRVATA